MNIRILMLLQHIGNYIANKGMRGSIENSALVLNES